MNLITCASRPRPVLYYIDAVISFARMIREEIARNRSVMFALQLTGMFAGPKINESKWEREVCSSGKEIGGAKERARDAYRGDSVNCQRVPATPESQCLPLARAHVTRELRLSSDTHTHSSYFSTFASSSSIFSFSSESLCVYMYGAEPVAPASSSSSSSIKLYPQAPLMLASPL